MIDNGFNWDCFGKSVAEMFEGSVAHIVQLHILRSWQQAKET